MHQSWQRRRPGLIRQGFTSPRESVCSSVSTLLFTNSVKIFVHVLLCRGSINLQEFLSARFTPDNFATLFSSRYLLLTISVNYCTLVRQAPCLQTSPLHRIRFSGSPPLSKTPCLDPPLTHDAVVVCLSEKIFWPLPGPLLLHSAGFQQWSIEIVGCNHTSLAFAPQTFGSCPQKLQTLGRIREYRLKCSEFGYGVFWAIFAIFVKGK